MHYLGFYNTCRRCKQFGPDDTMVRYSTRHLMHFACYLEAGKTLDDLTPRQIGRFPHKLLRERGLVGEAERLYRGKR